MLRSYNHPDFEHVGFLMLDLLNKAIKNVVFWSTDLFPSCPIGYISVSKVLLCLLNTQIAPDAREIQEKQEQ